MMHESRRSVDKRTCTAFVPMHPDGTCLRTDMNKINGLEEKNVSSSSE